MTITWESLLTACAVITAIGGVIALLVKVIKPIKEVADRLDNHERCITANEQNIAKIKDTNKLEIECLLRIVTHEINGNGIEGLKDIQSKMQEYLVEHHE